MQLGANLSLSDIGGDAETVREYAQTAEGTTPLFTINWGTTGWTTVIFLALLAILWKFAWGPILRALEARESGIQSALDEAAENQAAAAALLEEHKVQMADARREAQQAGEQRGDCR